jgi:hypothetical protein
MMISCKLEPKMDGVYVHLSSLECRHIYSNNTSSSFTNLLYKQLEFPPHTYECGLVNLTYTPQVKSLLPDKLELIVFAGSSKPAQSLTITVTYNGDFISFCNDISIAVNQLKFEITYNPGLDLVGLNNDSTEYQIEFDKDFSKHLGFNTNIFPPGLTPAVRAPDKYHFIEGMEEEYTFKKSYIPRPTKYTFASKNIKSLSDLILELNKTLESNGIEFKYKIDEDDVTVKFKNTLFIHLRLMPPLSSIFGSPDIFGSPAVILRNVDFGFFSQTHRIICSSDVIKTQFYGSKAYPVLRILDFQDKPITKTFNPIQYIPLSLNIISSIRFSLKDDHLELGAAVESEPTFATLHFRPKK